MMSLGLRASAL